MQKKWIVSSVIAASTASVFLFLNATAVKETWNFEPRLESTKSAPVIARSSGTLATSYSFPIPNSNDITDFLVQDVCVDANDVALPLDPTTCESHGLKSRNLKIGEDLPYSKFTRVIRKEKLIPVSMQDSYPFWADSGVRIMRTMNGAGTMKATRDFEVGDGYDILEGDTEFTSIIGTRDPVTTDANFVWFGEGCKKDDSWGLFPNNILETLKMGETSSHIFKLIGGTKCDPNGGFNESFTYYGRVMMRYTNNKVLETLKAYHFSHNNPSINQALEVFYHTRAYGFTRWEAWKTKEECVRVMREVYGKPDPEAACTPEAIDLRAQEGQTCNGPSQRELFGVKYYRTACSDNSHLMFDKKPVHPFSTPLTKTFALSRNLVKNSDFVKPLKGTYSFSLPNDGSALIKKDENRNSYLEVSGSFKGNHGFSQIMRPGKWIESVAVIQSGLLLKGPKNGKVKVQIDLYDEHRKFIESLFVTYKTSEEWAPARFNRGWNLDNQKIKLMVIRIIPLTSGTYNFDEIFTAYLPRR